MRRVSKVYGSGNRVVALNRIDLTVEKGEFVAIIGASGLENLHCYTSLAVYKPFEGKVIIEGTDISILNQSKAAVFGEGRWGWSISFII